MWWLMFLTWQTRKRNKKMQKEMLYDFIVNKRNYIYFIYVIKWWMILTNKSSVSLSNSNRNCRSPHCIYLIRDTEKEIHEMGCFYSFLLIRLLKKKKKNRDRKKLGFRQNKPLFFFWKHSFLFQSLISTDILQIFIHGIHQIFFPWKLIHKKVNYFKIICHHHHHHQWNFIVTFTSLSSITFSFYTAKIFIFVWVCMYIYI